MIDEQFIRDFLLTNKTRFDGLSYGKKLEFWKECNLNFNHTTFPIKGSNITNFISIEPKSDRESVLLSIERNLYNNRVIPVEELHSVNQNITPNMENKKNSPKIIWKAGQVDLVELFVTLEEKGWIEKKESTTSIKAYAKSISDLFDLSISQNKKGANQEDNFYQIMKNDYDRSTRTSHLVGSRKKKENDKLFFDKIPENHYKPKK